MFPILVLYGLGVEVAIFRESVGNALVLYWWGIQGLGTCRGVGGGVLRVGVMLFRVELWQVGCDMRIFQSLAIRYCMLGNKVWDLR